MFSNKSQSICSISISIFVVYTSNGVLQLEQIVVLLQEESVSADTIVRLNYEYTPAYIIFGLFLCLHHRPFLSWLVCLHHLSSHLQSVRVWVRGVPLQPYTTPPANWYRGCRIYNPISDTNTVLLATCDFRRENMTRKHDQLVLAIRALLSIVMYAVCAMHSIQTRHIVIHLC